MPLTQQLEQESEEMLKKKRYQRQNRNTLQNHLYNYKVRRRATKVCTPSTELRNNALNKTDTSTNSKNCYTDKEKRS